MRRNTTQNEEQSLSSGNAKRREVIELLFTKFAIAYRSLWHKDLQDERFQEYSKREWERNLKNFSDAIISRVTEICEQTYDMPPTMSQFIGLCKNEVNRAYVKNREQINVSSPEMADLYINKMKEILNKRR